jgi:hypothetical protein
MAAGDLLLFSRPITWANVRAQPFGTLMCALIHLTTRSRFNHAAIALDDQRMIEATNRGVVISPIESADEITVIPMAVVDSPRWDPAIVCMDAFIPCRLTVYVGNDRDEVLAWAAGRVGWKYGYVNAAICGLRNMWPGLQIKVGNTAICSELVAESLERSGHWFGKDSALVSPGDLAEHFGVPRR